MNEQHADQAHTKVPPPTAATQAYKAAARQMHTDLAVRFTGDADKDFASVMAAHHKAAVELAKIELQHGTDEDMRRLAQDIVDADQKQIALMQAWAAKHP